MDYWQELLNILGAERYAQHAICLTNDPLIMTLYVAADLTTWVSYFVIGFVLMTKRQMIVHMSPSALSLYGAFIFICGLSHFSDVLVLFSGVYRLDVAITAVMAAVSAVTASYTAFEVWGKG